MSDRELLDSDMAEGFHPMPFMHELVLFAIDNRKTFAEWYNRRCPDEPLSVELISVLLGQAHFSVDVSMSRNRTTTSGALASLLERLQGTDNDGDEQTGMIL